MKKARRLAVIAAVAAITVFNTTAMAQLPSDKYEQPKHTVVERIENIEIRDYASMLVAEVEVEGDRDAAANQGFRILAGYIFGGNTKRDKIAMTSPVTQAANEKIAMTSPVMQSSSEKSEKIAMTSPVTQSATETAGEAPKKWKVSFMLPSNYTLDSLPEPNDKRIQFRVTEPERRVAIRFSGFSTVSNLGAHKTQLEEFVAKRGLKTTSRPMLAFYDDPFTLPWNRRNEWWVSVEK